MPELQYTTKFKRIRTMRITVNHDGEVVVSAPIFAKPDLIGRFVRSKEKWIRSKIDYFNKNPISPERLFLKTLPKNDFKDKKERAQNDISTRVKHFAKLFHFDF